MTGTSDSLYSENLGNLASYASDDERCVCTGSNFGYEQETCSVKEIDSCSYNAWWGQPMDPGQIARKRRSTTSKQGPVHLNQHPEVIEAMKAEFSHRIRNPRVRRSTKDKIRVKV